MTSQRDWTPHLIGDTYCSSACGHGCTKAAYDEARRKGLALHNKMIGKAWQIRVWENLGWHYEIFREDRATHFYCSVSEDQDGRYTVYFNSTPQIITTSDNPNTALDKAVRKARQTASALVMNAALFPECER